VLNLYLPQLASATSPMLQLRQRKASIYSQNHDWLYGLYDMSSQKIEIRRPTSSMHAEFHIAATGQVVKELV
jgi:hypothetical protein